MAGSAWGASGSTQSAAASSRLGAAGRYGLPCAFHAQLTGTVQAAAAAAAAGYACAFEQAPLLKQQRPWQRGASSWHALSAKGGVQACVEVAGVPVAQMCA